MFIFDTCPKLTHLNIAAVTEDASYPITNQGPYPSLTFLIMGTTFSSITKPIVDYFSRFINLSMIFLNVYQVTSSSFENNYICLMNTLITPYKRRFGLGLNLFNYRKPAAKDAQMDFTRILAKCAIVAFKLQPRTLNSIKIIKVECIPGINIFIENGLYCKLHTWTPFSYLIKQDALSEGAVSRHLHELKMCG